MKDLSNLKDDLFDLYEQNPTKDFYFLAGHQFSRFDIESDLDSGGNATVSDFLLSQISPDPDDLFPEVNEGLIEIVLKNLYEFDPNWRETAFNYFQGHLGANYILEKIDSFDPSYIESPDSGTPRTFFYTLNNSTII